MHTLRATARRSARDCGIRGGFFLLACLALAGCGGVKSPGGRCLAFDCDEDGASAMMWATVEETYEPSEAARAELEQVFPAAVERMKREDGFKPESFELARGNLKRFLDEVPEQGDDALAGRSRELRQSTSKLCPLWPYC